MLTVARSCHSLSAGTRIGPYDAPAPVAAGAHDHRPAARGAPREPGEQILRLLTVHRTPPQVPVRAAEIRLARLLEATMGGEPLRFGDDA